MVNGYWRMESANWEWGDQRRRTLAGRRLLSTFLCPILLPSAAISVTHALSECVRSTEQRGDCFSVVGHFERAAGG